jgi:hypothetical protein
VSVRACRALRGAHLLIRRLDTERGVGAGQVVRLVVEVLAEIVGTIGADTTARDAASDR